MAQLATRTSIRPRPVDIHKQLNIVRDVNDLDKTDGLLGADGATTSEAPNQDAHKVRPATRAVFSGTRGCETA